jgi:RNA polymerase sigma factor (TIGR02999 family)
MNDNNQILSRIELGDATAAAQLLPLVYDELRRLAAHKLAHESPGNTLQATALVHEAYLRLVDVDAPQQWDCRGHFFAAAAEAMRRILINRARDKSRLKRGGGQKRLDWNSLEVADDASNEDLIAVDEALQKLNAKYPVCGELVKLRFFAGLTLDQAAECLGIGQRTADRYWAFARAWLYKELRNGPEHTCE